MHKLKQYKYFNFSTSSINLESTSLSKFIYYSLLLDVIKFVFFFELIKYFDPQNFANIDLAVKIKTVDENYLNERTKIYKQKYKINETQYMLPK